MGESAVELAFLLPTGDSASMKAASVALCALVALEHVYFLVLEMFLWTKPFGLKTFGLTPELAAQTASLAMNQGLYNGFLAAGLVVGLARERDGFAFKVFFLSCVVVAGVFGAATAKLSILFVQAVPGAIGLALVLLARKTSSN